MFFFNERSKHNYLNLQQKLDRVVNGYCQEAVNSVVKVESCPFTEKDWENAAKRKNCTIPAAQQKCSDTVKFVYHCLINGFQNETLEVCAPQKLIQGYILTYIFLRCLNPKFTKSLVMVRLKHLAFILCIYYQGFVQNLISPGE